MNKCYLCGSGSSKLIHHGTRDNSDIDVKRCTDCGLVYLSEFKPEIDEFYKNSGMWSGGY